MYFNLVKFREIHYSHLTHSAVYLIVCTARTFITTKQYTISTILGSDTKRPLPVYIINGRE